MRIPETPARPAGMAGLFDTPDELVTAAATVRDAGYTKWDCHTPYPVHGLDAAMGLRESLVPYVTLTAGAVGLIAAIAMTAGLNVFHYPIHVGGKPLWSWQAFVPIYFELFVLFASLATMGSVVFFCRLGRWDSPLHSAGVMAAVTSNRFAVVLPASDPRYSETSARKLLESCGCRDIRLLTEDADDGETL